MTDKKQQIENVIIYLIPVILNSLLPFITLPIFTRILTTEDYGVLALAQIYAILTSGIINLGLPNIYNRNFFQYRDNKRAAELLYSTLIFVSITFLTCAFLTYLFKTTLSKWIIGSSIHSNLLFWAFCSSGVVNIVSYYLSYLRNTENAKAFVLNILIISIMTALVSLFMVVYLRVGVIGLVWGPLLANAVMLSVLTVKFVSFLPVSFSWEILKFSLKLAYPTTPAKFFKVLSTQFDKYMIGLMAGVGGVGIYSIGQKMAQPILMFMNANQNVFMPQVYKKMFDLGSRGGAAVGRYLTPFLYISIAVAIMASLFAEEIISIVTPKSYHGAIDIMIIISMFYGCLFFGKQPQLLFVKKTFLNSVLSIFRVSLIIILNIPFIMKWGAIGAAWATLIAGLTGGAVHFAVSQYFYRIEWEYTRIGSIFLVFFFSSILTLLLRDAGVAYIVRLGVKLMCILLYTYIGIKIAVITTDNLALLRNMFEGFMFRKVEHRVP